MSEIVKDFIKFVAEVILVILILATLFGDNGVISNTANFLTYAEPTLIKDYLATALTVGGYAPGKFSSTLNTSGRAYDIKLYKDNNVQMVFVDVNEKNLINTQFSKLTPSKILVNCVIDDQTIHISQGLLSRITVANSLEEGCKLMVIV